MAGVVALIARRVERLLERRGLAGRAESGEAPDLWSQVAPVVAAARRRRSTGAWHSGLARARACVGAATRPREAAPMTPGPCHAHVSGFDLHAGLVTRAGQRDRLERLCRCALRPPLARDRLHVDAEGEIWLTLRHRWADGTTHLPFDPLELSGAARGADAAAAGQPDLLLWRPGAPAAWRAALRGTAWPRGPD